MNKIFHKGYFSEMFRQLKVIGIVAAIILMASNFTTAVSALMSFASETGVLANRIPGGFELAMPMMMYVYLSGLVFTFVAYNWLNRRAYSDFYHALPVTRKQMYYSTFLAIIIWMAIGLTAYSIVHSLIYLIFDLPFNYLLFFCVYVNMLIGAIEVVGAVSLACAISGTRFVNLFASIVILFVPRFLLSVMSVFIETDAPYMLSSIASYSLFFDPSYNIIATPYGSIVQMISNGAYTVNYAKIPAMIWSLCWSVLLVFLGGIAFNKRASETAGIPTKSKLFQTVVRTAIGLPLLLLLMYLIVNEEATLVAGVFLVLFSFIFYCLYELISTKSPKKMVKAMPLYFVCVGIALLYLVIPKLIIKAESTVKVDENRTKGFYVLKTENGFFSEFGLGGDQTYSSIKKEKIRITDDKAIEILCKAYDRNVSMINKNSDTGSGMWLTVKIDRTNGTDIVRNILFSESEYNTLSQLLEKNEDYYKAGIAFPPGHKYFFVNGLTRQEARKLAAVYEEEFASLDDAKKLMLKSNMSGYIFGIDSVDPFEVSTGRFNMTLQVSGCVGAKNFNESFAINNFTPKSLKMYIDIINQRNGDEGLKMLDELKAWFETGGDNGSSEYYVDIGNVTNVYFYDTNYGVNSFSGNNSKLLPKDADPEVYEMIKMLANAELSDDPENALQVTVYVSWHKEKNISYSSEKVIYLKLSDEDLSRIRDLDVLRRVNFDKVGDYTDPVLD
ncbi:MAG: hypothetical protein K6F68_00185 [Clostridiales bacterium]|nr:hypothetical protein [Clostridiales bacterium]